MADALSAPFFPPFEKQKIKRRASRAARSFIALAAAGVLSLSACAPTTYLPGRQVVTVEGRQHVVRKSGAGYAATMNRPILQAPPSDASVYIGNLKAIRDATGCPVALNDIGNENGRTTAKLACPAGTAPAF